MPEPTTDGGSGAAADPDYGAYDAERGERLPELARRAEQAFNENVDRLRAQTREAKQAADEQLEQARAYMIERVNEKPLATTLAVLGVGFVLGLIYAGGRR